MSHLNSCCSVLFYSVVKMDQRQCAASVELLLTSGKKILFQRIGNGDHIGSVLYKTEAGKGLKQIVH